jgi:hypothetical protein
MLQTAERNQMIEEIRRLPDLLERAVRGLAEEQLDTPYRDGGWTVRQVVHHLADAHMHAFLRMKRMLAEEHPTLQPYRQEDWAALPDGARPPVDSSLALLRGLHARWCVLLENVEGTAWLRTAFHPERGDVTVESFLTIYAGHGRKHVRQIEDLKMSRSW